MFSVAVFSVASSKAYKDEVADCLSSVHCATQVIWGANDQVGLEYTCCSTFGFVALSCAKQHHLAIDGVSTVVKLYHIHRRCPVLGDAVYRPIERQGRIQKYGLGGGREGVKSRPLPFPSRPLPFP